MSAEARRLAFRASRKADAADLKVGQVERDRLAREAQIDALASIAISLSQLTDNQAPQRS